jgi:adenosylmethionine-8-amino-7-oxononanoate aminotransferase
VTKKPENGKEKRVVKDTVIAEDIRDKAFRYTFIPARPVSWLHEGERFKVFVKGEGVRLTDISGNSYIDGAAGWQFGNVGHGRVEIGDAIRHQISELGPLAPEFLSIPRIRLAEKLSEITPGNLLKVALVNSGSEAVETALKMAKQYHVLNGEPTRFKVVARRGSYHGITWGAMSVQGVYKDLLKDFEPLVPMVRHVAQPYCYRCEYGLNYPNCDLLCAREIENVIKFENPLTVSAVLGEPVSHSSYVAIPPAEYWPMVRSICDRCGILLVSDEVITGFGRTGKWFGCMHYDFQPDIIDFAKGVTSGYIPMGGAITTPKIASMFDGNSTLMNMATWGGNPVSSAGALANIAIMEQENLVENSAKMGRHLLEGLKERLQNSPIVGDIRGIGLMVCIELVADKKTRSFFEPEQKVTNMLFDEMYKGGLLFRVFGTKIIFTPPLCIAKSEIEEIVTITERIIGNIAKSHGY